MNLINNDLKNEPSDNQNQNDFATKEQYVTVITLNDSAYGEIQKVSPRTESLRKDQIEEKNNESDLSNDTNETSINNDSPQLAKNKLEPIYSNTLETQKSSDKGN